MTNNRSDLMQGYGGQRVAQHVGRSKYNISSVQSSDFNQFTSSGAGGQVRKGDLEKVFGKGQNSSLRFEMGEPKPLTFGANAFNVLYVRSTRPAWMNNFFFKILSATVQETWELVEPLFRLGLPVNSIRNKCPYWNADNEFLSTTSRITHHKVIKSVASGSLQSAAIVHQLKSQHHTDAPPQPPPAKQEKQKAGFWPWQRKSASVQIQERQQQQQQQYAAAASAGIISLGDLSSNASPHTPDASGTHAGPGHHADGGSSHESGWPWKSLGQGHGADRGHGQPHGHGHGHGPSYLISHPPKFAVREPGVEWVLALNVALWVYLANTGTRMTKPY